MSQPTPYHAVLPASDVYCFHIITPDNHYTLCLLGQTCTCKAFQYGKGQPCKHLWNISEYIAEQLAFNAHIALHTEFEGYDAVLQTESARLMEAWRKVKAANLYQQGNTLTTLAREVETRRLEVAA